MIDLSVEPSQPPLFYARLVFLIPPVFSLFPLLFHDPPFLCRPLLRLQAEDDVVLLAAIPLAVLDSSLCWWISATAPLFYLLLSLTFFLLTSVC